MKLKKNLLVFGLLCINFGIAQAETETQIVDHFLTEPLKKTLYLQDPSDSSELSFFASTTVQQVLEKIAVEAASNESLQKLWIEQLIAHVKKDMDQHSRWYGMYFSGVGSVNVNALSRRVKVMVEAQSQSSSQRNSPQLASALAVFGTEMTASDQVVSVNQRVAQFAAGVKLVDTFNSAALSRSLVAQSVQAFQNGNPTTNDIVATMGAVILTPQVLQNSPEVLPFSLMSSALRLLMMQYGTATKTTQVNKVRVTEFVGRHEILLNQVVDAGMISFSQSGGAAVSTGALVSSGNAVGRKQSLSLSDKKSFEELFLGLYQNAGGLQSAIMQALTQYFSEAKPKLASQQNADLKKLGFVDDELSVVKAITAGAVSLAQQITDAPVVLADAKTKKIIAKNSLILDPRADLYFLTPSVDAAVLQGVITSGLSQSQQDQAAKALVSVLGGSKAQLLLQDKPVTVQDVVYEISHEGYIDLRKNRKPSTPSRGNNLANDDDDDTYQAPQRFTEEKFEQFKKSVSKMKQPAAQAMLDAGVTDVTWRNIEAVLSPLAEIDNQLAYSISPVLSVAVREPRAKRYLENVLADLLNDLARKSKKLPDLIEMVAELVKNQDEQIHSLYLQVGPKLVAQKAKKVEKVAKMLDLIFAAQQAQSSWQQTSQKSKKWVLKSSQDDANGQLAKILDLLPVAVESQKILSKKFGTQRSLNNSLRVM